MNLQKLPTITQLSQPVESRFQQEFEATRKAQYDKGVEKYGVTLHSFNGRDGHRDVMEEYIDLGRYMTQMQMEREALAGPLREALAFLKSLILPSSRQAQLAEVIERLERVIKD